MKQKLLLLTLLFSSFLFSQIKFENGYFLNNKSEKIECLIKNIDWKNTPTFFEYKLTESDPVRTANIKDVQEFTIYGESKYIRRKVQIDRTKINLNNLTENREPLFSEETIFMKELVKGDATLYKYAEPNQNRYFFSAKNGNIEQLIYKPYLLNASQMAYNSDYKKQLENNLVCAAVTDDAIGKTEYKEKDLISLFTAYNQCIDPTNQQVIVEKKVGKFNLNVRPRVNFSSLDINYTDIMADFGNKTTFGIGLELEYVLSFNRNKWSIIFEPTYQSYKSTVSRDAKNVSLGILNMSAEYNSIEIPIGFRHYMFLNNDSKLFVNAQYLTDLSFGSKIVMTRSDNSLYDELDVRSQPCFALGVGYNYKSKYAVEFRMLTNRRITSDYLYITTNYKTVSVILSYNLF